MSNSYDPFIESLVFDTNTISNSTTSDESSSYTEDLELWTNAQFTFDVAPGSAVEDKPSGQDNTIMPLNMSQLADPSNDLLKLLGLDLVQQHRAAGARAPLLLPKVDPSQVKSSPVSSGGPKSAGAEKRTGNNKRARADEELSAKDREAIEEDKRRRNTAASARFRAKKKIRERALEQSVKDMTDKSEKLEERVESLEREIKWLRTLLIEKNTKTEASS
ncbi:hypothetical protein BJV82DRAFT_602143 [Fennellomyces sp. T-0311]|nr:hypothetical protein BJV82DRAFT_602143 [Fennellomyces sp. T-0311]